jgi:hypothetical protein
LKIGAVLCPCSFFFSIAVLKSKCGLVLIRNRQQPRHRFRFLVTATGEKENPTRIDPDALSVSCSLILSRSPVDFTFRYCHRQDFSVLTALVLRSADLCPSTALGILVCEPGFHPCAPGALPGWISLLASWFSPNVFDPIARPVRRSCPFAEQTTFFFPKPERALVLVSIFRFWAPICFALSRSARARWFLVLLLDVCGSWRHPGLVSRSSSIYYSRSHARCPSVLRFGCLVAFAAASLCLGIVVFKRFDYSVQSGLLQVLTRVVFLSHRII